MECGKSSDRRLSKVWQQLMRECRELSVGKQHGAKEDTLARATGKQEEAEALRPP